MKHGFIRAAALSPKVKVADPAFNARSIIEQAKEAAARGASILVFPELCITGYTCGDLFLQGLLLEEAKKQLAVIAEETAGLDAVIFAGLPLQYLDKLYNAAAVLNRGNILGIVPKTSLPNYAEFYEARHFEKGMRQTVPVTLWEGVTVPMGTKQLFVCENFKELRIAAEI